MTSSADPAVRSTWPAPWSTLSPEDQAAFSQAREQTLNLVQWLARIANSYAAGARPEDRVLLDFTSDGRFVTRTFERELAVELRLPSLEMQFRERGRPVPHLFNPEERSPAEAEAWILVELLHRGLERDKFSKSLPYTIANLLSGDAEDYSPQACALGLDELTAWLRTAAAVLSSDGRVVCLPETLTLLAPEPRRGAAVGFSPGDAGQGEPYFFVDTGLKRWLLTASDLANEKDVAAVAARLIVEASAVRRA